MCTCPALRVKCTRPEQETGGKCVGNAWEMRCLPLATKVRKFRLEFKWETLFWFIQVETPEINGSSSEKVVLFSRLEYLEWISLFHLHVPRFSHQFQAIDDFRDHGQAPGAWNTSSTYGIFQTH